MEVLLSIQIFDRRDAKHLLIYSVFMNPILFRDMRFSRRWSV